MSQWPRSDSLSHHWDWRPEWHHDRPCLYWYLTFHTGAVAAAIGGEVLKALHAVPWLDPIPLEWAHVTLCDLGFVDEVPDGAVDCAFQELRRSLPELDLPELTLGPLTSMDDAVVLPLEPLDELRRLESVVRSVTEGVLGPARELFHQHPFWPHLSLGYVNRLVTGDEVTTLPDRFNLRRSPLSVEQLTLAAVTRQHRHYQWSVQASLSAVNPRPGGGETREVTHEGS